MPKKCKHCKGFGQVTPIVSKECSFCYNIPENTKNCYECNKKGWVREEVCETCGYCGGSGEVE